jgi:hypothetical protein
MILRLSIALLGATVVAFPAAGQTAPSPAEAEEALVMQLANPIASLISLPFQFDYEADIGPVEIGDRMTLNVQPVILFAFLENC